MNYFTENQYVIRKKVLKLVGGAFHIYDPSQRIVGYTKMKAFKLKEDLRMYESEAMQKEIFIIQARQVLDFGATYDVFDGESQESIGAFRRKGLKSILKDEWVVLDAAEREIGLVSEDNAALAMIRRFLSNLIPQRFECTVNGSHACTFKQHFNPFVLRMTVSFADTEVDRNLLMAGGILLCAIEGRQS